MYRFIRFARNIRTETTTLVHNVQIQGRKADMGLTFRPSSRDFSWLLLTPPGSALLGPGHGIHTITCGDLNLDENDLACFSIAGLLNHCAEDSPNPRG